MFRKKFSSSRTILKWWNTIMSILYLSKPVKLQIFFCVSDNTHISAFIFKSFKSSHWKCSRKKVFSKIQRKTPVPESCNVI